MSSGYQDPIAIKDGFYESGIREVVGSILFDGSRRQASSPLRIDHGVVSKVSRVTSSYDF